MNLANPIDLQIRHFLDADIGEFQDADIRYLLSLCFGEGFSEKRYAQEMPTHRWLVHDAGLLVGHSAAHEKILVSGANDLHIAGISEVCVRPEYRLHGIASSLLASAHRFLTESRFDFALLFGDEQVYKSSGYELKTISYTENSRVIPITALVRPLACSDFPASSYLPGPRF